MTLPTLEQVKAFIEQHPSETLSKRKLAEAFNIKGTKNRIAFKQVLRQLNFKEKESKGFQTPPKMVVVQVHTTGQDYHQGTFSHLDKVHSVRINTKRLGGKVEPGAHILSKISGFKKGNYTATPVRIVEAGNNKVIGVITNTAMGYRFVSTQRRDRDSYLVENIKDIPQSAWDEVYEAGIISRSPPIVRVEKSLCRQNQISLISAYSYEIPMEFSSASLEQVQGAQVPPLEDRVDVRHIPLVTIDGRDSRDFDDAIWAEPDTGPNNKDGWHLIVAIADVAHYVRPDSPLDKDAYHRGTSVYFPDMVIPMLPKELSNGVCSLNPQEDRAIIAVHIWIDKDGKKLRHEFFRGLMKSHARLVYEEVQNIFDAGKPGELYDIIKPLYGAYESLKTQREARGTLEIDVAEHYVHLDDHGNVKDVVPRNRVDSHRVIEEFMILANVAAAETLEANKIPCMYRVHALPHNEKIQELQRLLQLTGVKFTGVLTQPQDFSRLLQTVSGQPYDAIVNELVLRSQSQAIYTPDNIGHFGLNLTHYAHFTSPIRRYSDLLIHRGLLRVLGYKEDALPNVDMDTFRNWGEEISKNERRAASAERDSKDRYMTAFLAPRIDEEFEVYVTGVTRSGLFVTISHLGASGLVPINTLGNDYFVYLENPTRLEGRRSKVVYGYGDHLTVILKEVDLLKGRLNFVLKFPGEKPSRERSAPLKKSFNKKKRSY